MSFLKKIFLVELFQSYIYHRQLIISLTKRDILSKYKGSLFGVLWSFIYPIMLLTVYTFVFSVVFKAKWPGGGDSKTEFALVLFSGLMIFNVFSECISRAPTLIIGNVSYVKKVVFPIEILPVVVLASSLFHFFIAIIVWLIFYLIFFGIPSYHIFFVPIIIIPLVFIILGVSYFLAALGVFIRDIVQLITIVVTMLMFLSPLFYPVSALPVSFQHIMLLNPLTFAIEEVRSTLIWGNSINWLQWVTELFSGVIMLILGNAFFRKTKKGFADVL